MLIMLSVIRMVSQTNKFFLRMLSTADSNSMLSVFFIGACLPLWQSQLLDAYFLWSCFGVTFLFSFVYRKLWALLPLICVGLLGLCWTTQAFQTHQYNILPSEFERVDLSVVGSIVGLPVKRDSDVSFVFRVKSSEGQVLKYNTLLKLSCYRCRLDLGPDQHWQLTLRLKQPHGYASWGAFDYEKYLFRHQIVARGYVRDYISNQQLESPVWSIDQFRQAIAQKLKAREGVSETGLAMMLALGIGEKSLMSQSQSEVFQDSGVSHLMAISGLHIGLVFVVVSFVCGYLSYPFARLYIFIPRQYLVLVPALASAFLYAALAGFAVSTVRALVMLFIFVLCRLSARDVSLHKVLLVAACVIILLDPFSILDIGFWLSCGAVFIIASLSDTGKSLSLLRLQPLLWLGMLPLSALFFGQISLISPLVNLLLVPLFCFILIPLTLFSLSVLMLGLDLISGYLIAGLDGVFLFIFECLQPLTELPFSKVSTLQWSYFHTLLLFIAAVCYCFKARLISTLLWMLMSVSLLFPIYALLQIEEETGLLVSLLDVGQGLSMVIQVKGKNNYTLVYDTGPRYRSGFSAANAVVLPFLRSQGIRKIDRLIISHADNDHIGGVADIVKQIPITDVLTSRVDVLSDATLCHAGQAWHVGEVFFEILSPDQNTPVGSNNLSCVLKITHEQNTVLLTGDIEAPVERGLIASGYDLQANILLAPHHGSKTSSSEAFIDTVRPELVLASAGYLNHYNHAHPNIVTRYLERGIDFLSTVDNGSVIIEINKLGWSKVSYRDVNSAFWHHQKKPN